MEGLDRPPRFSIVPGRRVVVTPVFLVLVVVPDLDLRFCHRCGDGGDLIVRIEVLRLERDGQGLLVLGLLVQGIVLLHQLGDLLLLVLLHQFALAVLVALGGEGLPFIGQEIRLRLHHLELLEPLLDGMPQQGDLAGAELVLVELAEVVLQRLQRGVGLAGLELLGRLTLGVEALLPQLLELHLAQRLGRLQQCLVVRRPAAAGRGRRVTRARQVGAGRLGRVLDDGRPRRRLRGEPLVGLVGLHLGGLHDLAEAFLPFLIEHVHVDVPQQLAGLLVVAVVERVHGGIQGAAAVEGPLVVVLGVDGAQHVLGFGLHAPVAGEGVLGQAAGGGGGAVGQLEPGLLYQHPALVRRGRRRRDDIDRHDGHTRPLAEGLPRRGESGAAQAAHTFEAPRHRLGVLAERGGQSAGLDQHLFRRLIAGHRVPQLGVGARVAHHLVGGVDQALDAPAGDNRQLLGREVGAVFVRPERCARLLGLGDPLRGLDDLALTLEFAGLGQKLLSASLRRTQRGHGVLHHVHAGQEHRGPRRVDAGRGLRNVRVRAAARLRHGLDVLEDGGRAVVAGLIEADAHAAHVVGERPGLFRVAVLQRRAGLGQQRACLVLRGGRLAVHQGIRGLEDHLALARLGSLDLGQKLLGPVAEIPVVVGPVQRLGLVGGLGRVVVIALVVQLAGLGQHRNRLLLLVLAGQLLDVLLQRIGRVVEEAPLDLVHALEPDGDGGSLVELAGVEGGAALAQQGDGLFLGRDLRQRGRRCWRGCGLFHTRGTGFGPGDVRQQAVGAVVAQVAPEAHRTCFLGERTGLLQVAVAQRAPRLGEQRTHRVRGLGHGGRRRHHWSGRGRRETGRWLRSLCHQRPAGLSAGQFGQEFIRAVVVQAEQAVEAARLLGELAGAHQVALLHFAPRLGQERLELRDAFVRRHFDFRARDRRLHDRRRSRLRGEERRRNGRRHGHGRRRHRDPHHWPAGFGAGDLRQQFVSAVVVQAEQDTEVARPLCELARPHQVSVAHFPLRLGQERLEVLHAIGRRLGRHRADDRRLDDRGRCRRRCRRRDGRPHHGRNGGRRLNRGGGLGPRDVGQQAVSRGVSCAVKSRACSASLRACLRLPACISRRESASSAFTVSTFGAGRWICGLPSVECATGVVGLAGLAGSALGVTCAETAGFGCGLLAAANLRAASISFSALPGVSDAHRGKVNVPLSLSDILA